MSVPVMETRKGYQQQIRYVPISIGYAMWTPEKSKLELATELLGEIMPMLTDTQVILCFDSWYAKKKLIDWALSYNNVNIICNARHDTVMWDLPEPISGIRWSIETNSYEHKTFWSIDKYMVRKHIGIERLLNMINIAHSMTKILPYIDNMFYEYRNMSAQEFRHKLNELINKEIFFGSLADCAQTAKNSDIIMEFLAAMGWNQGYAA